MTGLNTLGSQVFSIQFNAIPNNPFPRDQTLYIFGRTNQINIYGKDGIKVIGR